MLGFVFGMMMGMSVSGSSPGASVGMSLLSQIPLRCYAAYDISEADYRLCRATSLAGELDASTRPLGNGGRSLCEAVWTGSYRNGWAEECDRSKHLAWELKALGQLKAAHAQHGAK